MLPVLPVVVGVAAIVALDRAAITQHNEKALSLEERSSRAKSLKTRLIAGPAILAGAGLLLSKLAAPHAPLLRGHGTVPALSGLLFVSAATMLLVNAYVVAGGPTPNFIPKIAS